MARPDVKHIIESNLDKIEKWTSSKLTNKQIAHNLGISESTFYKYKNELPELSETIKNGRQPLVEELENTMYMSACGYERKVKKCAKVKRCIYNDNGKKTEEWEELVEYEETQYFPPDTTAGIFLLKNWAKYMNEPRALELRKKEIELKEKQVEASIW